MWTKPVGRFAAVGFGAYIALTSLVGIIFGVQAGEGWLAIIYGALGISMGLAGAISTFVDRPLRSAFLGWFLVGIASRSVVGVDILFLVVGVPLAVVLLASLGMELFIHASVANTLWAFAGAVSSLVAFALLAVAAPHLPAICQPPPPAGRSTILVSYPPDSIFPWGDVALQYFERCATQG